METIAVVGLLWFPVTKSWLQLTGCSYSSLELLLLMGKAGPEPKVLELIQLD